MTIIMSSAVSQTNIQAQHDIWNNYFISKPTIQEHINFQNTYPDYLEVYNYYLFDVKLPITPNQKAKILVAAIYRHDFIMACSIVGCFNYELDEMNQVCRILDAKRFCSQLEKRTAKITDPIKLQKHKTFLSNTKSLYEGMNLSLNKSKSQFIKKHWVQTQSEANLYKYILESRLNVSKGSLAKWKYMIDILHLKPDDFAIKWFSSYVVTGKAPEKTLVSMCTKINNKTIKQCIEQYRLPLSFILGSDLKSILSVNNKCLIISYERIDQIIWYWSEIHYPNISYDLIVRLESDSNIDFPYIEFVKQLKKLIEYNQKKIYNVTSELINRLIQVGNSKLESYKLNIESPIAVLGDASASMDVAIKTSGIVMSVLCSMCDAEMVLFRRECEIIHNPPRNVSGVIGFLDKCNAGGSTSPAAALNHFLKEKKIVKTFIVITDEEENTSIEGCYTWNYNSVVLSNPGYFAQTFKSYYENVYPATLVFISFLNEKDRGVMVTVLDKIFPQLKNENKLVQYRMHKSDPDLRKFEYILRSLIAKNTIAHSEQYTKTKTDLNNIIIDI